MNNFQLARLMDASVIEMDTTPDDVKKFCEKVKE